MPRYELIGVVDVELIVCAAAPEVVVKAKADPAVEFISVDEDGNFVFRVPAYDEASYNVLSAIHVSLYEKPADGTTPVIPSDPADLVKAHLHYSTSTNDVRDGDVIVDATDSPEGRYSAALVAEFDE